MRKNKVHTRRKTDIPFRPIKPALLTLVIAQALAFQAAQAASIEVTSNLDDGTGCTLREAIATTNAGMDQLNGCIITGDPLGTNDTITFSPAVSGQTITTTQGELKITHDVSINPGGDTTTIDGNQASSRVMFVTGFDPFSNTSVVLNQLLITGGSFGGFNNGGITISGNPYYSGSLTLTNSTVSGNSGTGVIATDYSEVNLINSTVSGNSDGGIYASLFSHVNLTNSTVSGNTGDGISGSRANVRIMNSTISGNAGHGISGNNYIDVRLMNSIVANNTGRIAITADCFSGFDNFRAGPDTISTTACDGATVADPLLGPLADNGGPTQTHALLAGSPAIDNATAAGATTTDQRGVAAEGVRDSGAYEFTAAMNALKLEKLINRRVRETPTTAAQLLARTHYQVDYKVTNNSPDHLYRVRVFEGGQLVCNLYTLDPGESKQRCTSNKNVLDGDYNLPAIVTAKVVGSNEELANETNAYYAGHSNVPGGLNVTHYVNARNADTKASAVDVNGNQAELLFRVENTGSIELYRVHTFHDPASPVNSGWQQQCSIGTLMPGQVRYCKRTINVTHEGLNKAFGRAHGANATINATGVVKAANPTYFNVVLP